MSASAGEDAAPLIRVQLLMSLLCIVLAVLGGFVAALHYVPAASLGLNAAGLSLPRLRPLHETFASLWIFGAAIAVAYHWLAHGAGGLTRADVRRFWFHTVCWLVAGAGIFVSLLAGVLSGREYLGFHPAFSAMLLAGWLAFLWNVVRRVRSNGFFGQPVYVWFWTLGVVFFVITFVEGHAYLLPWVQESPIRDLQIQWKSCGTLVGSFNFLVYGALIYSSERISGDRTYGQSSIGFWLFAVGCLNSFTNYVHHTYHLPQVELAKWIAFVVSMLEIVILARLFLDVAKLIAGKGRGDHPSTAYFVAAKWWTAVMLLVAIVISVPSWNALIHGTHAVTGHAMGTTLGIDTLVLFGTVAFLLCELHGGAARVRGRLACRRMRVHCALLNAAMALLVGWLLVSGTVHGIWRYEGVATPGWVTGGLWLFPVLGSVLGVLLLYLVARWLPLVWNAPRTAAARETLAVE